MFLAGSRAEVVLQCVDSFGNAWKEGGAALGGQYTSLAAGASPHPQPCEVADRGHGLYALSYCLQAAGPFQVHRNAHIARYPQLHSDSGYV